MESPLKLSELDDESGISYIEWENSVVSEKMCPVG